MADSLADGLYTRPASAYRVEVEAAQLDETRACAPRAALLPLVLANLLLATFWSSPQRGALPPLIVLVAGAAGAALLPGRPRRRRPRVTARLALARRRKSA